MNDKAIVILLSFGWLVTVLVACVVSLLPDGNYVRVCEQKPRPALAAMNYLLG